MPTWLPRILRRIRKDASENRIRLTNKARLEAEHGFGLKHIDICDVLKKMTFRDFAERIESIDGNEWLYVFVTDVAGIRAYIKIVLRENCVVVSFHEDKINGDKNGR
ncbi:type II toxin-antitoxin system MqsR family toxin [bacterium]|nr:type II toxin-antitoxin system MqsR family toxin [bacterium]